LNMIDRLRKEIHGVTLRTSLIVGFPGETEENFNELLDFLKEYKLDRVGVFRYSQEEGTAAAKMNNQISEEVKVEREKEAMLVQKEVSEKINELKVNNIYDILVEGNNGEYYYGRNYEMIPEVDGNVFFKSTEDIEKGTICPVRITDCTEYDLLGVVNYEPCE
ncbi:MAG: 30S ribosomal protein S12 methylthiotransferase RimO, partial [Clostridium sp.]|nr:30S ribosomal protein S12 methylthiotransferase RimO [Clostridium sp.]